MSALPPAATLPPHVRTLLAALPVAAETLAPMGLAARARPVPVGARSAAVLVLLGPGGDGRGDVVLLERSASLRAHPGQIAFPGGSLDPADGGDPVVAALREAEEETGLDPSGVRVLGQLPALGVPVSGFAVTPVVAWEEDPGPLGVRDPGEVAQVLRVPLGVLADPATRVSVRSPGGWVGPAFALGDLLVWGFTGVLLAALLRLSGLERPWDEAAVVPLPARFAGSAAPGVPPPSARPEQP